MTPERKQAEEILLEVFEMGMDAQEIGMPSFDMIKQTGCIDKMIDRLASLKLAEEKKAYIALENTLAKTEQALLTVKNELTEAIKDMYPKAFVEWWLWGSHPFVAWFDEVGRFVTDEVSDKRWTIDELFEYWKQNISK